LLLSSFTASGTSATRRSPAEISLGTATITLDLLFFELRSPAGLTPLACGSLRASLALAFLLRLRSSAARCALRLRSLR
jgi:hypothetical protein